MFCGWLAYSLTVSLSGSGQKELLDQKNRLLRESVDILNDRYDYLLHNDADNSEDEKQANICSPRANPSDDTNKLMGESESNLNEESDEEPDTEPITCNSDEE